MPQRVAMLQVSTNDACSSCAQPLRWRLGAQLLVDDLVFGRGVVSM